MVTAPIVLIININKLTNAFCRLVVDDISNPFHNFSFVLIFELIE